MKQSEILKQLSKILNKDDIDKESPISRSLSSKHSSSIEILLEHVTILVAELRHDAESSKRELFEIRDILEYDFEE